MNKINMSTVIIRLVSPVLCIPLIFLACRLIGFCQKIDFFILAGAVIGSWLGSFSNDLKLWKKSYVFLLGFFIFLSFFFMIFIFVNGNLFGWHKSVFSFIMMIFGALITILLVNIYHKFIISRQR